MRRRTGFHFINILLLLGTITLSILWLIPGPTIEETKNILLIPSVKPSDEKPTPFTGKTLDAYREAVEKRNIFKPSPKQFPKTVASTLLKLTGIVYDPVKPHLTAAFILNTTVNMEKGYSENETVAGTDWVVQKIDRYRVWLVNNVGEPMVLSLTPDVSAAASGEKTPPKPPVLPPDFAPYKIDPKLISSNLSGGIAKEIHNLIKDLPPEFVYQKIAEFTDISQTDISPNVKLEDYVSRLFLLSQGESLAGAGEHIVFGTTVQENNVPENPLLEFSQNRDKRIYASFPNEGALKGLSKVVIRWTNTNDGTIAYLGTKFIDPAKPNNYIYVEKKKGWTKGIYQVELYRVDTMEKVGQGRFEVKD